MGKLEELISIAKSRIPAHLRSKVVIFGSAPLAQEHVGIRQDISDLDLFVAAVTFSDLEAAGFASRTKLRDRVTGEDVLHIVVDGEPGNETVEVLKTFQGVSFAEVYCNSTLHPSGFYMGSVEDVRRWKIAAGRPKDLADVAAIDRFLAG